MTKYLILINGAHLRIRTMLEKAIFMVGMLSEWAIAIIYTCFIDYPKIFSDVHNRKLPFNVSKTWSTQKGYINKHTICIENKIKILK